MGSPAAKFVSAAFRVRANANYWAHKKYVMLVILIVFDLV